MPVITVQHLRAAALATAFARDDDHVIGLVIQRAGFGASFDFHDFFEHKFRWAVFLEDAESAVAVRTKRLYVRIENGAVAPLPGEGLAALVAMRPMCAASSRHPGRL
jgi:hypothetical protein